MKIELHKIKVRDLAEGYQDNGDEGVKAYNGKLEVRPPYQREFVYDAKQQEAVIETIRHNFPLNIMYWAVREDGTFEVIDGQQRTISICKYIKNKFSCGNLYLDNLTDKEQEQILDYELLIYFCEGTDKEKLDWFQVINIAGAKLTQQEIRNAVYHSKWLSDAKRYFSKPACAAYRLGKDYLTGSPIRQDYLETVFYWLSRNIKNTEDPIAAYMAAQAIKEENAGALWAYFDKVISWAKTTFPKYRKEMKGVEWGILYNQYKNEEINPVELEKEVARLMADSDVKQKAGIYLYVFDHDEKHLSIRAFEDNTKRSVYERQGGKCNLCGEPFKIEEMHADHIVPWSKGGHTTEDNCQMLCVTCNLKKSNKNPIPTAPTPTDSNH